MIERGSETMHDPSWWLSCFSGYIGQTTPYPQERTITREDILGLMDQLPEIIAEE